VSDYVPKIEDVRSAYADENWGYDHTWEECAEQFDRWLEQHDKEVAQVTEQRIIKLLEDELKSDRIYLVWQEDGYPANLEDVIALIKGENK